MENMVKKLYWVCLLVLASCTKEIPQSFQGDVQYQINAEIDGQPVVIEAGKNNEYMFTNSLSDSLNVLIFSGNLENQVSGERFEIQIRNKRTGINMDDFNPDSAFAIGERNFVALTNQSPPSVRVDFQSQINGNGNPVGYEWDFGDGSTSNHSAPSHQFAGFGNYTVRLKVDFSTGCSSTIVNTINTHPADSLCQYDFSSSTFGTSTAFQFQPLQNNVPLTSNRAFVLWNFGDGGQLQASGNIVTYSYQQPGVYTVTMQVIDTMGGCAKTVRKNIATLGVNRCRVNFNFRQIPPAPVDPLLRLGEVKFIYRDKLGKEFSSDLSAQPQDSKFTIINQRPGIKDKNGKLTHRIEFSGLVRLYSKDNKVKTMLINPSVFAIGRPD